MKQLSFFVLFFAITLGRVQAQTPIISYDTAIRGLTQPMQVLHAGDGSGRLFIVEKTGAIKVFSKNYAALGTFLTVTGITSSGERGLLSLAFHPDYINNGFFYVYYTNGAGNIELSRYKVSTGNSNTADVASKAVLITIPHPVNANHNGGELHFGPEGYLYLSTGDGGGSGDTANNAQNTSRLLGKMLRFAVNTSLTAPFYTVPADNPFGNEIFAYGLRNPYRWEFDWANYDMWIGDVGQNSREEVNHRRYNSSIGTNYGWRCYEGDNTYNTLGCGPIANYVFPVLDYPTASPSGSIIGGTVYHGETFSRLQGWYLGIDYYTGRLIKIKYDSVANSYDTTSAQIIAPFGISDFGVTEDGELYATCLNNGRLYRIISDGPVKYVFTGNGNWDVAANWSNNKIPPATLPSGSTITIRPDGGGECVLNIPQTISPGAELIVSDDKQFRINGNLSVQ
jgi:glucose/arabinose dehydrogenase